jgi:hypothetical protein
MTDRAFLRELAEADNADVRQEWVEPLRMAANIITNNAAVWGIETRMPEALQGAARQTAEQLLQLAAALCGHDRVSSDGTCRYCERPVPEWPNV